MTITILTLFPQYFDDALSASMLGKAQQSQKIHFKVVNIRDFAVDKHKTTDDRPFSGGAGMVMKIEPIYRALKSLGKLGEKGQLDHKILLTSARGELFSQQKAIEYSRTKSLVVICGHYEGVDQRVADYLCDSEIRIGDYVLTGGEPAALVIADAVCRLIPQVLGNEKSLEGESHSQPGFISPPVYTRPEVFEGMEVPPVLLTGHHSQIQKWQDENSKNLR